MQVIAVTNQKGGVGKTTHAIGLACALLDAGFRVLFCDVDTQGNSTQFFDKFKCSVPSASFFNTDCDASGIAEVFKNQLCLIPATPALENVHRMGNENLNNLRENLKSFPDGAYDFCIIDTPPAAGFTLKAVVFAADYIFMPMELKQWSIEGSVLMLQTIFGMNGEKQQLYGEEINFLGILINMYDRSDKNQGEALEALKVQLSSYLMIGQQDGEGETTVKDVIKISQKNVIEHAQNLGVPVWKYNDAQNSTRSKAATESAREFTLLYSYLFDKMGIKFNGLINKVIY